MRAVCMKAMIASWAEAYFAISIKTPSLSAVSSFSILNDERDVSEEIDQAFKTFESEIEAAKAKIISSIKHIEKY